MILQKADVTTLLHRNINTLSKEGPAEQRFLNGNVSIVVT